MENSTTLVVEDTMYTAKNALDNGGAVWGAEESADKTVLGWNTRTTDPHICSLCGNDERAAKLGRMLGLRPDVAFMKLNRANMLLKEMTEVLNNLLQWGAYLHRMEQGYMEAGWQTVIKAATPSKNTINR